MLNKPINTNKESEESHFDNRASVTVETAVVFPAFISVILFAINIIYIVGQYEMLNFVLNQTCSQMSDYAYLYHEKGIVKISDAAKDKLGDNADAAIGKIIDKLPIKNNGFETMLVEFVKGYLNDSIDRADDQLYIPITRFLFLQNLDKISPDHEDMDFNFSNSRFFNGDNDININLSYKVKIIIPFINVDSIDMNQSITMNSWMSGIWPDKEEANNNIWELDNFQRGRKIQTIFNANLPFNFPVISSYINNRVIMIKSLDFTTETYSVEGDIYNRIVQLVNTLKLYEGQNVPWGKDKIVIRSRDILDREIVLVIPGDEQDEVKISEFKKSVSYAKDNGIVLTIKTYGFKHANAKDSTKRIKTN